MFVGILTDFISWHLLVALVLNLTIHIYETNQGRKKLPGSSQAARDFTAAWRVECRRKLYCLIYCSVYKQNFRYSDRCFTRRDSRNSKMN